jgi:hypothetical protein
MSKKEADLSEELDKWGFPVDPAERMQQAMLAFYEMVEAAQMADFSPDLLSKLKQLRLSFIDEFEQRFPGYGKGRAVWR